VEQNTHELFTREEQVVVGSDRTFGWVMAAALALLTCFNAWHSGRLWPWTFALAAMFAIVAAIRPAALNPLNRAWTKLGLLLHKIANPVLMGLIFFGTILPTGLVMRWIGKDALRLKRDESSESYWIRRPPGPAPETMRNQF
jgi:hypothetical protein